MASKLVLSAFSLSAVLAVGAAPVAVRHSLRQHRNQNGFEHPLNLITRDVNSSMIEAAQATHQECGAAVQTTATDINDFHRKCDPKCPLFVEDRSNKGFCDFACVSNSIQSCKDKNPMTPVADPKTGVCRRCKVTGCFKCHPDGTERCETCMEGYQLKSNGYCGYTWGYFFGYCAIILVVILVLLLVIVVIGWIVDLFCRENVNEDGLAHALDARSRAKIHMPKRKLFLKESTLKKNENGEYEVLEAGYYVRSDKVTESEFYAEVGDIVTGIVENGWFKKDVPRKLWPLTTNLCTKDVAGPAVTLLFNFQAAIIIWSLVIVVTWKLVCNYTDDILLTLGKKAAETDRQNCIVVQWGHDTQERLMYVKVGFLVFCYLWSFLGAIAFGIRQWRLYTSDTGHTHRDFCACFNGLPKIKGDVLVEDELKEQIQKVTGQTIVGVSVGWVTHDKYDDLQTAMNFNVAEVEKDEGLLTARGEPKSARPLSTSRSTEEAEDPDSPTFQQRVKSYKKRAHSLAMKVEGLFLHPVTQALVTRGRQKKKLKEKEQTEEEESNNFLNRGETASGTNLTTSVVSLDEDLLKNAIKNLHTGATCFVVFESEFGRDAAVEAIKEDGLEFRYSKEGKEETCVLRAEVPDYEPQSVLWQNLSADHGWKHKAKKFGWMLGVIILTCLFLATFEYGYAIIQINNVRSSGEEGITLSFILFTVLVASMMACLCAVSATVADMAMFERVGHRETCFVLLYTFSVVLQVSLDAVIAYAVGKNLMVANGIRTHDGTLLEDLNSWDHFTEIFSSYAMQKHIGVTILSFGFPCAFLVPFLAEPIVSIFLPYKIMSLLVKSHPELTGLSAEGYMEAVPMDLGRYGDCMINVIIASMILWFPSGFNLTMFTFLFCSHCYIYMYDHYRVLRSVASVYIATYSVDYVAQWIFSIPCAIIAAALTFKLNCEPYVEEWFPGSKGLSPGFPGFHGENWGTHCDAGWNVWVKVGIAFFGHIALHSIALLLIVAFCGKDEATQEDHQYKDTAALIPCSWFSGNLVHCLRSKYVYAHEPPQDMCVMGKEHCMRLNPMIGAFFRDVKAESEAYGTKAMDFGITKSISDITKTKSSPSVDK